MTVTTYLAIPDVHPSQEDLRSWRCPAWAAAALVWLGALASTASAQQTQPNAADLYRRAFAEIESALRYNTDDPVDYPVEGEPGGDVYSEAPWPRVFELTAVARTLFLQATSIERCDFGDDSFLGPLAVGFGTTARLVEADARSRLDKQPAETLTAARALLYTARHLDAQPSLYAALFALRNAARGIALCNATLDRHPNGAITTRELRRVLEALKQRQQTRCTLAGLADRSLADSRALLQDAVANATENEPALVTAQGRALELIQEVLKPLRTAKPDELERVRKAVDASIAALKAKYGKDKLRRTLETGAGEALAATLASMVIADPTGLMTHWVEQHEALTKTTGRLEQLLRSRGKAKPKRLVRWTVMVDGHQREALLDLPAPMPKAGRHPVVFAFHGHGGKARGLARALPLREHWPEAIIVYPQGIPTPGLFDRRGKQTGWQHTGGDEADRDLRFFDAMLAELQREHDADPHRVHATGHSNGGGFCYVLLAERGHLLASAAPSSASMTQHIGDVDLPQVPILHCGSPDDRVIPWRLQLEAIERLREKRQCAAGAAMAEAPQVTAYRSPTGGLIGVYKHEEGHRIPRRQAAITTAFFKANPQRIPPLPPRPLKLVLDSVQRVWDRAPHQAFTDLCIADNEFLLAFREGDGHVYGADGSVRVLRSKDGRRWESAAVLTQDGVDLRDPKISLAPNQERVVLMGGSRYDGKRFLGRTTKLARLPADAETKATIVDVTIDPDIRQPDDWLWRICWHQGAAYGVVYQPKAARVHLVRSADGDQFELVKTFDHDGKPSEATVRATPTGELVALLRRDAGNHRARIGSAAPPFTDWTWAELPTPLGGPELLVLPDGRMLAAGRVHTEAGAKTTIGEVRLDGTWLPLLELPSGGDTSYPGMVRIGDRLLVSYYSSHEGKTSIYVAHLHIDR